MSKTGLSIKAALERAAQHERQARRKLRVRVTFQFGDGHHADGLVIAARFAARNDAELTAQNDCVTVVPYADLDARAGELVALVDATVRRAEMAVGTRPRATDSKNTHLGAKPKVIVVLRDGRFSCAVADRPVEVMTYQPELREDRLYSLTEGLALSIDPADVAAIIQGETVGHVHDDRDELLVNPPKPGRLQ